MGWFYKNLQPLKIPSWSKSLIMTHLLEKLASCKLRTTLNVRASSKNKPLSKWANRMKSQVQRSTTTLLTNRRRLHVRTKVKLKPQWVDHRRVHDPVDRESRHREVVWCNWDRIQDSGRRRSGPGSLDNRGLLWSSVWRIKVQFSQHPFIIVRKIEL